jgi:hypothetical protein
MFKMIISIITAVSLCLLLALINITTPVSAGPLGILSVFVLTYLLSLGVTTFLLYFTSCLVVRLLNSFIKKQIKELTFKQSYYYSTILAAVPVMLIGLQSVGAIGVYELLLIGLFAIVGCIYISKRA